MEAATAGTVPVVAEVGDLADLVSHRVNGVLVRDATPTTFAREIANLLDDPLYWERLHSATLDSSRRYGVDGTAERWNAILLPYVRSRSIDEEQSRELRNAV
jgi:glycosyltransferase involved in cell wall biosynthesis